MKNKGFGKFEVLTMIVLLMAIIAYILWYFLAGSDSQKFNTMKKNAINFSKVVSTNNNSFHNTEHVYLGEVITEGLIPNVKSPFSGKDCSVSDSKVDFDNDLPLVTLQCDNYLIDAVRFSGDYNNVPIYKVGKWQTEKPKKNYEEKVLYNCMDGTKEKYPEYYEELYFVFRINEDFGRSHFFASTIGNDCRVVTKTFYRTKVRVK
ncbi:MAG: hypothetical protein IJ097_01075 [Bacilli bacterium]|nr:hypothetical protein [Bacilli bacterium]